MVIEWRQVKLNGDKLNWIDNVFPNPWNATDKTFSFQNGRIMVETGETMKTT